MSTRPDYDVAIVGGGISGIYTAWRLLTSDVAQSPMLAAWAAARPDGKLKVAVFERSDRIGGRLLSAKPPGMPNVVVEIGSGAGPYADSVWRIGLMGANATPDKVIAVLGALKEILNR